MCLKLFNSTLVQKIFFLIIIIIKKAQKCLRIADRFVFPCLWVNDRGTSVPHLYSQVSPVFKIFLDILSGFKARCKIRQNYRYPQLSKQCSCLKTLLLVFAALMRHGINIILTEAVKRKKSQPNNPQEENLSTCLQ